jgi:DNA-binding transcriptional regulator LsrR (DeoR family)
MITLVRTATALPGKIGEAVVWGKEVAAIVERVTGMKGMISTTFGGQLGGIAWTAQYDNAAQVEEAVSKLNADRDYLTALAKAQNLFVPGSGHDQMWRRL